MRLAVAATIFCITLFGCAHTQGPGQKPTQPAQVSFGSAEEEVQAAKVRADENCTPINNLKQFIVKVEAKFPELGAKVEAGFKTGAAVLGTARVLHLSVVDAYLCRLAYAANKAEYFELRGNLMTEANLAYDAVSVVIESGEGVKALGQKKSAALTRALALTAQAPVVLDPKIVAAVLPTVDFLNATELSLVLESRYLENPVTAKMATELSKSVATNVLWAMQVARSHVAPLGSIAGFKSSAVLTPLVNDIFAVGDQIASGI